MSEQKEYVSEMETLKAKILHFKSIMSIEPMMFIQALAWKMIVVSENQMLLYKICREERFNLTAEYCSNFEDHTNETSFKEVEKEVTSYYYFKHSSFDFFMFRLLTLIRQKKSVKTLFPFFSPSTLEV